MNIKVKEGANPKLLSIEQLEDIACWLQVSFSGHESDNSIKSVWYGNEAPFNTCMPWQKTDDCGFPVGKVKSFKNGRWA